MEIFFVVVNNKRLETCEMGKEPELLQFQTKEEAEAYINNNNINNAIVMSSSDWTIKLQHRIANRHR